MSGPVWFFIGSIFGLCLHALMSWIFHRLRLEVTVEWSHEADRD